MPLYNSQAVANSPLQSISPGDPPSVAPLLFNAETPAAGQKSIAVAIVPRLPFGGGPATLTIQLECPLGIGSGVFQVQDADVDNDASYDSINFGGATPGQITSTSVNASGTARVELTTAARFARVACITAPSNPVTVRVGQK